MKAVEICKMKTCQIIPKYTLNDLFRVLMLISQHKSNIMIVFSRVFFACIIYALLSPIFVTLTDNLTKYNKDYDKFITSTVLRDIAVHHTARQEEFNVLLEALKLERFTIVLIILLSLMAGAASVVIIYYQQTLAKYIITQTPDQQYKWFGIIVGCIVFRFLAFNYLMGLTNNVAMNVRVSLSNLFMRAIFFLDGRGEELNMHRMRFLAIQALIEAIIFIPYALISFCTIVGLVVLVFNLDNYYGFIYFGIVLFCVILHCIILVFVYRRLRRNEESKDEMAEESKWIYRSLIPLIFDRISEKIISKMIRLKSDSLYADRFYNFTYSFSQFAADLTTIVPIIIYYGINHNAPKDLLITNVYLTAVYLGMLYYPFKIFVFGSYTIIRGAQQYSSMTDNFHTHISKHRLADRHLPPHSPPFQHTYPDNLGDCYNYQYSTEDSNAEEVLPPPAQLQKSSSNLLLEVEPMQGETIMVYFSSTKKDQVELYVRELVSSLPLQKTVAVINENHFVLPDSFQQNILFYSQYDEERFHKILRLLELDYFIPQIEALGNAQLNYRIAKYYSWHESRLQVARALYNNVDYLIIHKHSLLEDLPLLSALIAYRKQQQKVTLIANNWYLQALPLADTLLIFHNNRKERGTYAELIDRPDSVLNQIRGELREIGVRQKSEQLATLHENFLSLVKKQPRPLQLKRSIYLKFFGFAHCGGALVVLLALIAPVAFKVYINWLIGQSIKTVIYPDILGFGVAYLFLIFLRGLILSFYFRLSSMELFKRIVGRHRQLCGDQMLSIYKEKDDRIENDFKKVDSNLVVCFELGISVLLETYGSLIIIALGQPIVLAMGVPVIVLTALVNLLYNKIERKLLVLRERYQEEMTVFVNHCTARALTIFKYGKYEALQARFAQMHRVLITFYCNEMWILSGMRMLGEIIIIIGVTVFLIIMIETQSHKISNLAMVSYGVSLFVNMNFSYRFNLKTFAIIEAQSLALTKCIDFYKTVDQQVQQDEEEQINVEQVDSIEFRDVNIEFGHNQCSNIHLKLSKGDRVAVTADSKSMVTLPFYLLRRRVFSKQHIKGDILINGTLTQQFNLDGLFYLHYKPLLPYRGCVFDVCQQWNEQITREQCSHQLQEFLKDIGLPSIFGIDHPLNTLNIAFEQVLAVFRAVYFQKCKILVMISAFDYLDILSRIRIEKYLIARKSINILINITNNPEITSLYQRRIRFRNAHFCDDQEDKSAQKQDKKD